MVARLKRVLLMCWYYDTASPGDQSRWTSDRPSIGQCAVTALVVQDLMGGQLVKATVEGFGSHYWNRLDSGEEVDLTRNQFPPETVIPPGQPVERDYLMKHERSIQAGTPTRYRLLSRRVQTVYDLL
jgi:hypothetical protein